MHDRRPPEVGEVLRLIDDERVELLAVGQRRHQLRHLLGQPGLPEVGVVAPAELSDTQVGGEVLEGPDEVRTMPPIDRGHVPLEPAGQPHGVAEQRHPLTRHPVAAAVQLLGLGHGEHRLPAARSPSHLGAVDEPRDVQDGGLLDGEAVGAALALVRLGKQAALWEVTPLEDLHDEVAVIVRGHAVSALLERCHVVEPTREIGLVATPADHPPRAVRRLEVSGKVGVRGHDRMAEADPAAARVLPSWVALDVRTQGVLAVPPLVDRVDDPSALSGADDPCAALNPEVAALDLDDHDADVWHQDDEVELMVLLLVGEPDVGEHRPVVVRPA